MAIYQDKRNKKWKAEIWFEGKKLQTKSFPIKILAEQFEREEHCRLIKNKTFGITAKDYTYK